MHLLTGLHRKLITVTPIINHSCRSRHRYSPQTFILGIVHDIIIIISIVRKHNKTFIIAEKKFQANENKFFSFFFADTSSIFSLLFSPADSLCVVFTYFPYDFVCLWDGKYSQLRRRGLQNTSLIEIFEIKKQIC